MLAARHSNFHLNQREDFTSRGREPWRSSSPFWAYSDRHSHTSVERWKTQSHVVGREADLEQPAAEREQRAGLAMATSRRAAQPEMSTASSAGAAGRCRWDTPVQPFRFSSRSSASAGSCSSRSAAGQQKVTNHREGSDTVAIHVTSAVMHESCVTDPACSQKDVKSVMCD